MVQINKTKNRIMRFLRSLFVKKPKAPFPYSVKGFRDARKWAMTQPHPYAPELCLWDYARSQAGTESEIKLHIVNKFVKGILDDETMFL
jgi:hypothetical protein